MPRDRQQQFLVGVPYILLAPVLVPAPWWVYTALVIFDYLLVDWMHRNVPWGARWIEGVFVTPRYHHIRHSANLNHYNLVWDRLSGTYLDPSTVRNTKELDFGIGEKANPVRLIAGL